jgi:hypothetical protein
MPYTTPPTFADDDVLSAAQLNILSDNIEYLYGLSASANIPFPSTGGASGVNATFFIRHRSRYLYVRNRRDHGADPGAGFQLTIDYGGVEIYDEDTGTSGVEVIEVLQIDLDPLSLVVGTWYAIDITFPTNSFSGTYAFIDYIYEADS